MGIAIFLIVTAMFVALIYFFARPSRRRQDAEDESGRAREETDRYLAKTASEFGITNSDAVFNLVPRHSPPVS